jgi:carbamoyl-phosphate synthase small subunit
MPKTAQIILVNGSVYGGYSFGFPKSVSGELVFNTGMVGYPETLTDPSYKGQILVLTYPLIGNYGVPPQTKKDRLAEFFESEKIQILGLVISDYSFKHSHFNAGQSLAQWLREYKVPAVYGVDTRALTKELRAQGTMPGKLVFDKPEKLDFIDPNQFNLVEKVSVKKPRLYQRGRTKVVLIDCGVKNSIIRSLLARNITVIRVPWDFDFTKLRYKYHGILISNGPGDPKKCEATIIHLRGALSKKLPIMGICLGTQILALAAGGDTYKLKFGHRSQNQPCILVGTNKCYITSQNHGYAVKPKLPTGWKPWFVNANDKTIEGIKHARKPFMAVQFHPEANPGPGDTAFLFDEFVKKLNRASSRL